MTFIFFARTDTTSDLTRYFRTCGEAIQWADDHASEDASVWRIEIEKLNKTTVVDLLNGVADAERVWDLKQ